MGMFDTIDYKCINCESNTYSQTKLGACFLDKIKVGEIFLDDKITMNLIMKDECESCKLQNCIEIVNGKIISIIPLNKATHKEICFGNLEKIKPKSKGKNNG
jgi:hypothetical protein